MTKQIIIIGGGISGLSLLHYLKLKYFFQEEVVIRLLEKNDSAGGTIQSVAQGGYLFEAGPNGFLATHPRTLELIKDLHLLPNVIEATREAQLRYVLHGHKLQMVPTSPLGFFTSPLLNPLQKLRVFCEPLIPKGRNPSENVYAFAKRRFGKGVAEIFVDPVISGIYGGNASELILKEAFPKVYEMEQAKGSVLKGVAQLKNNKSKESFPYSKQTLLSFFNGMSELTHNLTAKYRDDIDFNQPVSSVSMYKGYYVVQCPQKQYTADQVFVCTPAYQAGSLVKKLHPHLSDKLLAIHYAPLVVIGLAYSQKAFRVKPSGFGYLIPSSQKSEVLGVLLESNIFTNRCEMGQTSIRLMIGGMRHPNICDKSSEELTQLAIKEIKERFNPLGNPKEIFFKAWPQAIPQYDGACVQLKEFLIQPNNQRKNLHFVANYLDGVSFNDCIENAYQTAKNSFLLE